MTAPNTTNNVTVRKLANVAEGMWNKSKNAFVNASGDTMTGRLTLNSPLNQVITGTGTAGTSSGSPVKYYPAKWNFDLDIGTPSAGDRLVIQMPCAGSDYGVYMSTDNGTTYYPVAHGTGSTRMTTRYPSGAYICVVFEAFVSGNNNAGRVTDIFPLAGGTARTTLTSGCWRVINDYDSGNNYERTYLSSVKYYAGSTGIKNKTLICLDKSGTFSMLTSAGSGQGSDKTINTDGKFKLDAVILFYVGNDTAANALAASNSSGYVVYPSCDARYSYNPSGAMVANKPLYIECTVDDDGFWSPTTKCITQTLEMGKYYIFLGLICNDSSYTFALAPQHPLYYYDGTNLTERPNKVEASQNNGNIKINGTETTVYTHPTDAGNKHIPAGGSSGQFLGYDSDGTAKWVANPNTDTKVKATAKTDDANYKILATASASPTSGAATEAVYDTDITLNPSTNTISANVSGTAASAGKLTTARTTYVTLGTASTSTTRDWSGTTTIPVSGTLGIGNGGTGSTSAAGARTNLDVYSKSETESLLNGQVVIVTVLPATGEAGKTYYVKDTSSSGVDKYDEYIWAVDAGATTESWIHVGEKSLDLSEYVNSLTTSGTGPLVKSLAKSGNALTATLGTIAIDNLSDWASSTDVTVSSVTYHTWWPVAPTSSNQVYGLSIYNGRLYRVYNNKGSYSVQAYDKDTTYTNKALGQGYGTCATEAATAAKIVTMSDYALTTGGIVTVKFTYALCASATMNINGKGAKPIYIKGAAVNNDNAATVSAGDTAYFMYDGTAYHLLGTDRAATNPIVNISRSGTTFTATRLDGTTFTFTQQDNNTTYTQAKLGQGYGTCTTAEATAAKSVTLTGYELEPNGVVAVKFTNGLCASATMSINGKTATPIYINGAAVTTTSCKEVVAGDLAFFIYDGSHYQFICTDRISKNGITGLSISGRTITYTRADGTTGTLTTQDTTYSFDGTYNASTNKAATVSTVTNAINALDVDDITGFGAGKTLATLTETDGKIAATFQNISITKSQVSDFSHSHGNITNDGKVGTTADYAVVTTTGGAVTATSLATSSPSTSGNTLEFIDTVSQNSKGKISATKKKVTIDATLSSSSTNPVQNTRITEWINRILGIEGFTTSASSDANSYLGNVAMGNLGIANSIYTSKIYAYSDNEANADLKWDSSTATAEQLALYQMGKKFSSSLYAGAPGETIRIDISSTTYNYLRGIGFYVSVKDATSGATTAANAHLKEGTTEYQAYRVSTSGSWCVSVMSSTARVTVSLYIVPSDSNTKISVFGIRAIVSGAGDNNFALPGTSYDTEKLKTARQLAVSLSNTSTNTTFDGSANVTNIKVSGTLPIANGGTGATTKKAAEYAINGDVPQATAAMQDNFQIVFAQVGSAQNPTNGVFLYRTASTVWNYMKGKLSSDSNVNISGNSATASAAQTGSALETAIDSKANIANSVYYVVGSHDYTAYSTSATYTKWTSGAAYTSSNSCVYGGIAYYCSTAISTPEAWTASHWTKIPTPTWTGTIDGITELSTGLKLAYKVPIAGGSSSTYLNINGLGTKYIRRNDGNTTTHLPANTVVFLAYDGTYWRWADYDSNSTYSGMVTAYINNAGDAAKTATSTNFKLTNGITIILSNNAANTRAAALTLNVNSTGAKPLYINGEISSATNYTIPVGTYFCHYDGTNWNLWTDGTFQTFRVAGPADYASDALPGSELERKLDSKLDVDDIETFGLKATYDEENHRLIFDDILFDSIYPTVGKYGLAIFPENETVTATEFDGDRDWLLDWRPYLVDMTAVIGETRKRPVAELMKNNWLRKIDGTYAPVAGITSTQSTALDGKTDTAYWKTGSAGDKISTTVPAAFDTSGNFVPSAFWEYVKDNLATVNTKAGVTYNFPIEVKIYVGSTAYSFGDYSNNHIPAPWETTETKYSIFIGRTKDCYLVDGYSATTGEHMRGLTAKPVEVGTNAFDPENFKLSRTGISPGPCTTKGNLARSFFYNYVGTDTNTKGVAGTLSILYNNGTYPRTSDVSQYTNANWARACNPGGSSGNAVPVGEGGYHALNAFICSIEAGYGTRNAFGPNMFSSGNSSNDACGTAAQLRTNGGFSVKVGTGDTNYRKFNDNLKSVIGSSSDAYVYNVVNGQAAHFQCMEPQIAASLAVEMNISANTDFSWNGGTWHWEVPTAVTGYPITGLLDGQMNCRIYKEITYSGKTIASIANCSGSVVLRCALAQGVNPVGDIFVYNGGGAELVYLTDGTGDTNYKYSFYLEPDQTAWLTTNTTEKFTSGTDTFPAESAYTKLIDMSNGGNLGNTYCLTRTGYTPVRRTNGGSSVTGECCYQYRTIGDDAKGATGIRSRRRLLFRGTANSTNCSPRYLVAHYRPSNTIVTYGLSAQVLLA